MADNRTLPFGYRMELGNIVIHPKEAELVRYIFQQYVLGASYNELVEVLRKQDVPYDQGKIWNKNMVARILKNEKYLGIQGWPVIVTHELFERVRAKRSCKVTPPQRTEAQKVLRKLIDAGTAASIEHQVLCLLNRLTADPQQICVPKVPPPDMSQVSQLQTALEQGMEQQSVDEDAVKQIIMDLTCARYETMGNQEYETERLQRLFARQILMQELDAELLRSTVAAIRISSYRLQVCLKNGQIIEGGTAP